MEKDGNWQEKGVRNEVPPSRGRGDGHTWVGVVIYRGGMSGGNESWQKIVIWVWKYGLGVEKGWEGSGNGSGKNQSHGCGSGSHLESLVGFPH